MFVSPLPTQRLGSATQKNPEFIDKLVNTIKNNPGRCDEVWFASDYGFPPLEVHEKTVEIITEQAKKFREIGVRVSLQISNTIGHGEYMKSQDCSGLVFDGSQVEHLVGADGTVADYCFCWNGEHFRDYVVKELQVYAKIKPHTVWFDDDLRPVNHTPVDCGCFCASCVAKFNAKYGTSFDRDALVEAISFGEPKYREMFAEFSRSNLYDFSYLISKTVCDISPDTEMGYQFAPFGGYIGFDFDYFFEGLTKGSGKTARSRPGGGCYDAHNPNDILAKSMFLEYGNSKMPSYVKDIRPEIENLPDVVYGKSVASTCFETTVYLARGANAMSYAMIMNDYESFSWHNRMFGAFASYRRYWEKLAQLSSGTVAGGLPLYHSENMWRRKLSKKDGILNYSHEPVLRHDFFMTTGIPITHFQSEGVCLLTGEVAGVISDEDIEALLKRNVITDGAAACVLTERGFGEKLGIRAEKIESRSFGIEYEENEISGAFYGKQWKKSICEQIYDYRLTPCGDNVTVLAGYTTKAKNILPQPGKYPFGIAEAVTQTAYSGKWAVLGYEPWTNIISTHRRNYLIAVADYLGENVSAYVESALQSVVMPRMKDGKVYCVSVINCELYGSGKTELVIRNPHSRKPVYMDKDTSYTPSFTVRGNEMKVQLSNIEGWSVGTVYFE